jgi:hypothetical protein
MILCQQQKNCRLVVGGAKFLATTKTSAAKTENRSLTKRRENRKENASTNLLHAKTQPGQESGV